MYATGLRPFDVVSIDAEGISVDILRGLLVHCPPLVICVEHEGKLEDAVRAADIHGYSVLMTNEENVIFKRMY